MECLLTTATANHLPAAAASWRVEGGEELELTPPERGNGRWEYLTGRIYYMNYGHWGFYSVYRRYHVTGKRERTLYDCQKTDGTGAGYHFFNQTEPDAGLVRRGQQSGFRFKIEETRKCRRLHSGILQADCGWSIRTEVIRKFKKDRTAGSDSMGITRDCFRYPVIKGKPPSLCEGGIYMSQNPENGDVEAYNLRCWHRWEEEQGRNCKSYFETCLWLFIILLDMDSGQIIFGGETVENSNEKYRNNDYTEAMRTALVKMMRGESWGNGTPSQYWKYPWTACEEQRFSAVAWIKDKRYHWTISYTR